MITRDTTGLRKTCCEHSLMWHHETRGCGYHGHAPEHRCPCLLPFDEALAAHDAEVWPCANYAAPVTCLTAPSSESGRCDHCRAQAAEARRDTAERIAQAMPEAIADRVTWGDGTEYIAVADAQRIAREEASRG